LFRSFGLPEILLILVVVLLVFGVGRIGKIASELGSAIRKFRDGLQGQSEDEKTSSSHDDAPKEQ
jgi:sec-independent protein translocase protein TatA